uniref:Sjogrens syndrome scleroderma autoantigen 1 n=1 Tax=Methanococcus maripaludis (strain C6 / ATCC BAA-1332) TaxID=444158 RepID=A9A8G2_METM6
MDEISIASKELAKGAKMLGKHCTSCGFPIFEKDGLEYCPNCNGLNLESKDYSDNSKIDVKKTAENSKNEDKLKIIDRKIEYLFSKLDSEEELGRINEITSSIKTLFKIKKYL